MFEVKVKPLPDGDVAHTLVSGGDCDFPRILGAYDAIGRWVAEHERETAGPPREVYFEQTRWEVVWPLG